jgi:hypothetical protein
MHPIGWLNQIYESDNRSIFDGIRKPTAKRLGRPVPLAGFAYNNSTTSAPRMTPFYINYGYHPPVVQPLRQ